VDDDPLKHFLLKFDMKSVNGQTITNANHFTKILHPCHTRITCISYNHHHNLERRFTMMILLFRKTVLLALVVALGVASLPFISVSAAGQAQISNERLEKTWARQLRIYALMGRTDNFVEKAQQLIERASENGKDVSALQAALDAFETALKDAQPIYESAKGIVNSHQGFDDNGKVTDAEKAQETVRAMGEKLKEIKAAMDGTGKSLREALRAFRQANPRPGSTSTP
jgi:hypothetical protein